MATDSSRVVLRRPPPRGAPVVPDDVQRSVVDLASGSGAVVVLGAPGTGKTTVLVESAVARVLRDGIEPDRLLLLAPSRRAASALRERVTGRLARTVREPLARTAHAYAFGLLRRAALRADEPAPRLLSGPEQDQVLRELLAGHEAGEGRGPRWPDEIGPQVRALRGFRGELRELVMRATERGLTPADLRRLAAEHARPVWAAAAAVMAEYRDVTSLGASGAFDPAAIVDAAVALLDDDQRLLASERERWALVGVDDHHESTVAVARLLDRLRGGGGDLLVTGDPDASTQTFRGADPGLLGRLAAGGKVATVVLPRVHRQGPVLRAAAARVAGRVGSAGAGRQRAASSSAAGKEGQVEEEGAVSVHLLGSFGAQAAFVADLLRRRHLLGGVPWESMAVVVRSGRETSSLRRALGAAGVPVVVPVAEVPVRDEPAVRPLRLALRCVLDPDVLDAESVVQLLTSAVGGCDAVSMRRLRQDLRHREHAQGRGRSSDDLLVAAVLAAAGLADDAPAGATDSAPVRRVGSTISAGTAAAATPGATAETVLWALWSATGLGPAWQRAALRGGRSAARAHRDLDAVLALFEAAARFVDRLPVAAPLAFLDHLEAQDVPADTLAERAPSQDAVSLVTAAGAAGLEWEVVVVAGLQEGRWPDLRPRGSLLETPDLLDVLAGREPGGPGARRAVLDDELRLLHVAVSRARRELVLTAVQVDDERASPFLDLVEATDGPVGADGERVVEQPGPSLALSSLVARLRVSVTSGRPSVREAAAMHLARLAVAGVPGAAPEAWAGVAPLSDDGPLARTDEEVTLSPSRVEAHLRCSLRWLLETSGGSGAGSTAQALGTLVHDIAADYPDCGEAGLQAVLDERWATLDAPGGWVGEALRRRADRMVAKLAEYLAAGDRSLVGVERDLDVVLATPAGPVRLRGRVDRLERDGDGRLHVVDLKTGRSKPSAVDVPRHPQLGVYQVAVAHGALGEGASGGAELVHLGDDTRKLSRQKQAALAESSEPRWALELVETAAAGMRGAAFPARENKHCAVCPVRTSCPLQVEGRQVGA